MSADATLLSPAAWRDAPQAARTALADGFAVRVGRWAQRMNAAPADIALLTHAARELALAACDGHVCLPLRELPGTAPETARRALLASGAAVEADSPQLPAAAWPLVIDGERLYLRHFFDLETRLAAALTALAAAPPADAAPMQAERLRAVLDARFPPRPEAAGPDWQKVAAALAFEQRLTIISGGPGTGKTTTVAAFIACLLELEPALRIALAAPTGKAATRMREALAARAHALPEAVRTKLPGEAHTLHRLLGATPESGHFRHHAANPLALDLLVVDEASMLDLALAAALLDALPAHARLILLGDKDQLAAVEAGAVFADLSANWHFSAARAARLAALTGAPPDVLTRGSGEGPGAALADSVVWLTESHRFRADSGIGRLAREINAGEGAAALDWLGTGVDPDVVWIEGETVRRGADAARAWPAAAALAAMENGYAAYFAALRETPSGEPPSARAARVFAAFARFRVLVAVHGGPCGLAAINAHLVAHARAVLGIGLADGPFWAGRPVIVLKNDPVTRLFNGDIGLCLPDADGAARVFFPTTDGLYRALPPQRLPEHDTAFALTVHKSQGSEFAEVLFLLPARPSRVLSRELLYTAITRATRRVVIAAAGPVFAAASVARGERFSGLGDRLRGGEKL
ncbi:MAG: exodeoxyribonuclease V subunit alpha [Azoarcus sp.]|jgi:exodeoxyribonuclease V alpha subunit|nr:exodeoxyribonuclease V subunit alpha [Azoarcus sp.]